MPRREVVFLRLFPFRVTFRSGDYVTIDARTEAEARRLARSPRRFVSRGWEVVSVEQLPGEGRQVRQTIRVPLWRRWLR